MLIDDYFTKTKELVDGRLTDTLTEEQEDELLDVLEVMWWELSDEEQARAELFVQEWKETGKWPS